MLTKDEVIALGLRYTKWGVADRYALLYDLAASAPPGEIVEAGVAMGGSAVMLAGACLAAPRKLHLLDSFVGLPEPTAEDGPKAKGMAGRCAAPEASVRAALAELGYPKKQITTYPGFYEATLPGAVGRIGKIAVLHIDADWYASCKLCLQQLAPKVVSGGVVIMDDYGFWQGCAQAVTEFFAGAGPYSTPVEIKTMPGSPQAWWHVP